MVDLLSSDNVAIVASFSTFVGVLIAAAAIRSQGRLNSANLDRQWLLHSATLATTLGDNWDRAEMRAERRKFATTLNSHYYAAAAIYESNANDIDCPAMLFLEHLAALVRLGAIHEEIVWNSFGWFYVGY